MINCSTHHSQFIGYSPTLNKPLCSQCPAPSESLIPFNNQLPHLQNQISLIESSILQQLSLLQLKLVRDEASQLFTSSFVHQSGQSKMQALDKLQASFWALPETKLVFNHSKQLDWGLLQTYGVIGQEVVVQNLGKIKQYLQKRIGEIKQKAEIVQESIKVERGRQSKISDCEPFEELAENNSSSGSEANDLIEIGIPGDLKLEDINQQITRLIEKKRATLLTKNRENGNVERVDDSGVDKQKGSNKKETSTVTTSEGERVDEEELKEEIETEHLLRLIVSLEEKVRGKKYEESLGLIGDILKIEPCNAEVLHLKARILLATNETGKASETYSTLNKQKQGDNVKYQNALLYLKQKKYPQCKNLIDQLFASQPLLTQYYILKGDYLLLTLSQDRPLEKKIQNSEEILELYSTAIKQDPKRKEYIYRVCLYYINQKNYRAALVVGNEALELDPENVVYLKTQAWLSFKLSKHEEALMNSQKAISIEESQENMNNYAVFLFINKQHQQAKLQIQKLYTKYPTGKTIILNTLTILFVLKQFNQAFEIVKQTFDTMKSSDSYILKCCEIAIQIDEIKDAKLFLQELKKIREENKTMKKQFALGFYLLGSYLNDIQVIEDGIEFLSESVKLEENQKPELYNMLGVLKVAKDQSGLKQFKSAISSCLQIQLKSAYLWNCSIASYKEGELKESLGLIDRAIGLEKKGKKPKYREFRIYLLIKSENYADALGDLKEFNRMYPAYLDEEIYERLVEQLDELTKQ